MFMEALTLWIDGQPEALVLGVLFAAVLLYVVAETAVGDKLIASAKETVSIHSKLNSTPSPEERCRLPAPSGRSHELKTSSTCAERELLAYLAAILFGISTPMIQRLGHGLGPFYTAALLYTGAAMVGFLLRRSVELEARLLVSDTR